MISCTLGGYTYLYNPPDNTNPVVRAVSVTETLLGRVYTDFGSDPSRQDITQKWDVMDAEFFRALEALVLQGGTLPYIDEYGESFTVIALAPTYDKVTPGGDAFLNVTFKLLVVSKP